MSRDALAGAAVGAAFGLLWTVLGTAGLAWPWRALLLVPALAAAAVVAVRVVRRWRAAAPPPGGGVSMFATTRYRVVLVLTAVVLFGGNLVLGASGLATYTICWTAFVVGAHFLAFARSFAGPFAVIGAVTIAVAAAGALVGVAGGPPLAVSVVTGAGVGLFFLAGALRGVLAPPGRWARAGRSGAAGRPPVA